MFFDECGIKIYDTYINIYIYILINFKYRLLIDFLFLYYFIPVNFIIEILL